MTSPGGTLTERLQLVVDATTNGAEAKWSKLTGTVRETGDAASKASGHVVTASDKATAAREREGAAATKSASAVAAAADRVAAAREREQIAAGNLRVAETRLVELRESGRAKASQLVAAEEKVATAQRSVQLAMRGTTRATQEQIRVNAEQVRAHAEVAVELGRSEEETSRLKGHMDGLVQSAVAFGALGLVNVLRGVGDGFATSARDAGLLANSMNASVEQAGSFLGLVGSLGLDLNDLLEIQAEFAQKVAANASTLDDLGVQVDKNADGTTNWAGTLVDFMGKLQNVDDATERNRLGFMFLGEEGYKQLSKLVSSGVSVADALERIGVPITSDDIAAAADFDAQMMSLSLTSQQAEQALGRLLLPVITSLAEAIGTTSDAVADIPPVFGLATAAALTLGLTGFSPTAVAGARLTVVKAALTRQLALYNISVAIAGRSTAVMGAAMGTASAAGRGLLAAVGGPLGAAMIGLGAAYSLSSNGFDDFRESAKGAAVELSEVDAAHGKAGPNITELSRRLAEEAGFWDGLAASQTGARLAIEETGGATETLNTVTGGAVGTVISFADKLTGGGIAAKGYSDEIKRQQEELGGLGVQQQATEQATRSLTDLIAQGETTGRGFADAVGVAADAQARQAATSDTAEAAIAAYNATTRDAVQTTLDLFAAQLDQRGGLIGLQQDIYAAKDATDDLKTPWNEVDEATNKVIGSVLDYASTAADAAVAAATANGTVLTGLAEAQTRAQATVKGLRESLNQPGISKAAREQIQGLIEDLEAAQKSGDIKALLTLTGAKETGSELDKTTKDRDTHVRVETRNGPAVDAYLDRLTKQRLILLRAETRNGPAVDAYLDRLTAGRRALIRVESRNGPAVDDYLDRLASQTRIAYIDVRQRGGATALGGVTGARGAPPATAGGFGGGSVTIQSMAVTVQADASGRVTPQSAAEGGREVVRQLGAYTRQNGSGWLRGLSR